MSNSTAAPVATAATWTDATNQIAVIASESLNTPSAKEHADQFYQYLSTNIGFRGVQLSSSAQLTCELFRTFVPSFFNVQARAEPDLGLPWTSSLLILAYFGDVSGNGEWRFRDGKMPIGWLLYTWHTSEAYKTKIKLVVFVCAPLAGAFKDHIDEYFRRDNSFDRSSILLQASCEAKVATYNKDFVSQWKAYAAGKKTNFTNNPIAFYNGQTAPLLPQDICKCLFDPTVSVSSNKSSMDSVLQAKQAKQVKQMKHMELKSSCSAAVISSSSPSLPPLLAQKQAEFFSQFLQRNGFQSTTFHDYSLESAVSDTIMGISRAIIENTFKGSHKKACAVIYIGNSSEQKSKSKENKDPMVPALSSEVLDPNWLYQAWSSSEACKANAQLFAFVCTGYSGKWMQKALELKLKNVFVQSSTVPDMMEIDMCFPEKWIQFAERTRTENDILVNSPGSPCYYDGQQSKKGLIPKMEGTMSCLYPSADQSAPMTID